MDSDVVREACKVLRINSKFRTRGSSSDFIYSLGDSTILNQCLELCLVSARIPRLFGNIYAPINVLLAKVFQEDGSFVQYSLPCNTGQFNAVELAAEMTKELARVNCTCSYDTTTHRFSFMSSGMSSSHIVLLASSPIAQYIGLTHDLYIDTHNEPIQCQAPPTLDGPSCVYVQSYLLSRSIHCVDALTLGSYIPLVAVIPCQSTPYGFTVSYEANDINLQQISYRQSKNYPSLNQIDLQLCDQFGNILPLPDNAYCDLLFRVTLRVPQ